MTPTGQQAFAHSDDIAVDKFAAAMKAKMAKQRAKGYSGWDDKEDCSTELLQKMLADHITKGDPVDVGNFAMMLFNRGEVAAAPKALAPSREVIGRYMADKGFYLGKEALDGLMLKLEGIGGTP